MLLLNPSTVRFDGSDIRGVLSIAIDRAPAKLIAERGELGPYPTFVDVPAQLVTITLVHTLHEDDIPGPELAHLGVLQAWTAASRSEAGRVRVEVTAVITKIEYDIPVQTASRDTRSARPPTRTITFTAISTDGKIDPIATFPAASGAD